ncbi:MAG: preprotein translocase subunit SecG [Zetaproteobacteria bacterium]|nr:MAG: preprotein translocase subunit SecG [Zetaproteobacteria bacterium]
MTTVLVIVHVLVALLLIGVVLIQKGQGAEMGVSFGGGGAQTLFGSRGSGSFLGKLTGGLAAMFMLTSLSLAFFSQQQAGSVVERAVADHGTTAAPARQKAAGEAGIDPSKLKDQAPEDALPPAE